MLVTDLYDQLGEGISDDFQQFDISTRTKFEVVHHVSSKFLQHTCQEKEIIFMWDIIGLYYEKKTVLNY